MTTLQCILYRENVFSLSYGATTPWKGAHSPTVLCKGTRHVKSIWALTFESLAKSMILLKRDAVDKMEKERARLLAGRAIVVQSAARRLLAKLELKKKREIRRRYASVIKLQSICRRGLTRSKYSRMVQAVRMQERKRQEEEAARKAAEAKAQAEAAAARAPGQAPPIQPAAAPQAQRKSSAVAANSRAAVLQGLDDEDDEEEEMQKETEIEGYLEDDDPQPPQNMAITAGQRSQALTQSEDVPPVSPLCIRIQVISLHIF